MTHTKQEKFYNSIYSVDTLNVQGQMKICILIFLEGKNKKG